METLEESKHSVGITTRKIEKALGKWLHPPANQRMRRFAYRDPADNTVYLYDGARFRKYNSHLNLIIPLLSNEQHFYEKIPTTVIPNNLRKGLGPRKRLDPISASTISTQRPLPRSFEEYLQQ